MADKDSNVGKALAVGAGLIATAAASYFLYGPKGRENRKKIQAWTVKAKGDVLAELERMKNISEEAYIQSVDKVAARYAKMKEVGDDQAQMLATELKKYWKQIQKDIAPKPAKKAAAKKTVKKAVKK